MRVMFDVDGCLRNLVVKWQSMWNEEFGYVPQDPVQWDCFDAVGARQGLTPEQTQHLLFNVWGWDLFTLAKPYPTAREAIDVVRAAGHTVIIATHQMNVICKKATLHWLTTNNIIPDEVLFVEDKLDARADFYLEDKQSTLKKLAAHPEKTVGMVRPWNRPDELDITWVKSPLAYARLIEEAQYEELHY